MTTITPSGSKVTITGNAAQLRQIANITHKPVHVGNEHVPSRVSIPAKQLPKVRHIIQPK